MTIAFLVLASVALAFYIANTIEGWAYRNVALRRRGFERWSTHTKDGFGVAFAMLVGISGLTAGIYGIIAAVQAWA